MVRYVYPARVYLLIGAFAAMALVAAISRLGDAASYADPYPFRTQFTRLAAVRPMIAGQTSVGYISNIKPGERRFGNLYFPTQFVLAPTLLSPIEDGGKDSLVLGNFTRQEDYAAVGREYGLEVVREFPMGVVLYRRAAPQRGGQERESGSPEATP